jgi:hypothetical protein
MGLGSAIMSLIQILINMGSPSLDGVEVDPCKRRQNVKKGRMNEWKSRLTEGGIGEEEGVERDRGNKK